MALTSKEKLFKSLADNGWTVDPRAKRPAGRYSRELVQNPNVLLRDAKDGGQWRIELGWTSKGSTWHRSEGDRLKSLTVEFAPSDIEYEVSDGGYDRSEYVQIGILKNDDNSGYKSSFIWDALKWIGKDGSTGTLRQVVELVLADPETTMWLAKEHQYKGSVKRAEREAQDAADAKARRRPLPVTVPQSGWKWDSSNEWAKIARTLESAAERVVSADGKSDLPQLVANAQLALEAIQAVLTDEALEKSQAIVYEAHTAFTEEDKNALAALAQSL